jgi:hypothetical protein
MRVKAPAAWLPREIPGLSFVEISPPQSLREQSLYPPPASSFFILENLLFLEIGAEAPPSIISFRGTWIASL